MRNSLMARSILLNPGSDDARQQASKRFDVWLKVYGYAAVMVTDSNGVVQLKEPAYYQLPEAEVSDHVQWAFNSRHRCWQICGAIRAAKFIYGFLTGFYAIANERSAEWRFHFGS